MNKFKTKLAGSAVFTAVLLGVGATTYGITQAQLLFQGASVNVTGVVSAVDTTNHTITITTVDASPITFATTPNTKFSPIADLTGILVGDTVLISGNSQTHNGQGNKTYVANSIKEVGGPGYGTGYGTNTNKLKITNGRVNFIDLAGGNFTVQVGTTYVNFEVHSTTNFNGKKNFASLKLGDKVQVTGEDVGTYFLADKVVVTGGK